jgi:hypothetical protein
MDLRGKAKREEALGDFLPFPLLSFLLLLLVRLDTSALGPALSWSRQSKDDKLATRRPIFAGQRVPPKVSALPTLVAVGTGIIAIAIVVALLAAWIPWGSGALEQELRAFSIEVDTQSGASVDLHRTYLTRNHRGKRSRASFWHDVPLSLSEARSRRLLPFVNEISVGTSAKMEITKDLEHTPIIQDRKNDKPRFYPIPSRVNVRCVGGGEGRVLVVNALPCPTSSAPRAVRRRAADLRAPVHPRRAAAGRGGRRGPCRCPRAEVRGGEDRVSLSTPSS